MSFRALIQIPEHPKPELVPVARSSHTVRSYGNKVYIYGGEGKPREPLEENGIVHEFDLESKSFSEKQSNPVPSPSSRLGHSAEVLDGVMYMYGGRRGVEFVESLSDLWAYDTASSSWSQLSPTGTSPGPRSYQAMTKVGKYLAIFGGCGVDGRLSDVVLYDPLENRWITVQTEGEVPVPRGGPALVGLGQTLVVFGGFCGNELGDLWTLPLPLNENGRLPEGSPDRITGLSWTLQGQVDPANPQHPGARSVMGYCALSDQLMFIFGGEIDPSALGHEGAGLYSSAAFVWNLKTNEWQRVEEQEGSVQNVVPVGWFDCAAVREEGSATAKSVVAFGGLDEGNNRRADLVVFTL